MLPTILRCLHESLSRCFPSECDACQTDKEKEFVYLTAPARTLCYRPRKPNLAAPISNVKRILPPICKPAAHRLSAISMRRYVPTIEQDPPSDDNKAGMSSALHGE